MHSIHTSRLLKLALVAALIVGVMAVGLLGNQANRALAQDSEAQTYTVIAGDHGPGNIEVLAFAPIELKIHQGDTVTWLINSVHNVRFAEEMANLIIVDDQGNALINPIIAFPNVQSGDKFTEGANSGLSLQVDKTLTFSLVMDMEPGRYTYFCDVHPGMVGVIEVVADDVAIPTPNETNAQAHQEMGENVNKAFPIAGQMSAALTGTATEGKVEVAMGNGATGRATVNLFAPNAVVIHAGETVVWTNPLDSVDVHFINSLPWDPVALPEVIPDQPDPNAPPTLVVGPGFLGTTEDGATVGADGVFNSGFLPPGASYSLIFSDPGTYAYFCHIHPGMNGVVVVEAGA